MRDSVADTLDALAVLSRQQRVLFAVAVAAPFGVFGCAALAGATVPAWALVGAAGFGLASAAEPDSPAPLGAVGFLGWSWFAFVRAPSSPWAVAAGLLLLALHACSAAAATLPPGTALPGAVQRSWRRRLVIVAALTLLAWLVVSAARLARPPGDATLTAAVLVLVAGLAVWLRRPHP